LRDNGVNLLLAPLFKTDHIVSMVIVLDREDVEVHHHAPQTKAEHFWLYVWVNCHLEKTASWLGKNIWTIGCTWLPKTST
jgi:hypothetical protein